ncbi:MAG TPA: NAD-dependent epimerase/dehydratase family protein [Vicinamibacterales bacterium]|nr:NAD-dependent epimerase/dehydratase family protein [Vicinamibacterales bacterium]
MSRIRVCLVTGSSGLVGSAIVERFGGDGWEVHGIDNNQREVFFGVGGDTAWNTRRLQQAVANFRAHDVDVRDRARVSDVVRAIKPSLIVHAAAQPSHDKAAAIPFDDFTTNAVGTLHLLEAARAQCADAPFVFMSTNKVYGDRPNSIPVIETPTRWEYAEAACGGVGEDLAVDRCLHSLFGASKLAADVLVQEYGRYYGLPTCCIRAGCITGPHHAAVELHGFLAYLVKCNVERREYRVYGYKGKQVRDNIHARDVATFVQAFYERPRPGEVYNVGGGKANSCSILEAFALTESVTGQPQLFTYVDQPRRGDHICYYSNLEKARSHYPEWKVAASLEETVREIAEACVARMTA